MDDFTLHDALNLAVKTEQTGAEIYSRYAERFSEQKEVAEVFKRLAKDELVHEAQFKKILEQAQKTLGDLGSKSADDYLKAAASTRFFGDQALDKLGNVSTVEEALVCAADLERATLLYYYALKDVLGEQTALDQVIKAEKEHLTKLMQVVLSEAKFRGLSDNWS